MGEVIAFPARPRAGRSAAAAEPQHFARPNKAPTVHNPAPTVHNPGPDVAPSPPSPVGTSPNGASTRHPSAVVDREPLWREVTGGVLREERLRQRRTLAHTADRAGMSVQYLSELERGRKEASSEMLAAACGSLGLGLGEFARRCAGHFSVITARPSGPLMLAA